MGPRKSASLQGLVLDVLALAGIGLIAFGVWEIYRPAGLIAAGLLALGVWALKSMAVE